MDNNSEQAAIPVQIEENVQVSVTARDNALMYASPIVFRRWAATVLDYIVSAALIVMSVFAVSIPETSFFYKTAGYFTLFCVVLVLLHYLIIEGLTGYTLGKLVLRIRVVDNDFNPPGIGKAFIRTILRLIEVNPLLFGGIPAGIIAASSKAKQRLGDMAAGTFVLQVNDIPVPRKHLNLVKYKKLIVIAFIFFTVLSFAGGILCITENFSSGNPFGYTESGKAIYGKDDRYQITFPSGWTELKDSKDYDMYVVNYLKAMYFNSISINKSEFSNNVDMDIFVMTIETDVKKMFTDTRIVGKKEISVNGYPAAQLEVTGVFDGEKVFALVTMVETPETYYRFIAGVMDKMSDINSVDELQKVVQSFREIKKG